MVILDFLMPPRVRAIDPIPYSYRPLPDNCVLMQNTPFTKRENTWEQFYQQLKTLQTQISYHSYIFLDASYDPVYLKDSELQEKISTVCEFFPNNKVVLLSSAAKHYLYDLPNIVFYPWCFLNPYKPSQFKTRNKRISCLNRHNTPHRVWLMYNLLNQGLIDDQRDIYSISFVNIYDENLICNVGEWIRNVTKFDNDELRKFPPKVATHPDNFPNDWSTDHPAWQTAIAIITETEPGDATMVTEKTIKGFMSRSCWTSYMDESGYKLLEEFGFQPRLFPEHASHSNIDPIINICKNFDTNDAMDYYHSKIDLIEHNFEWYGGATGSTEVLGPWFYKFLPKFQSRLNNL